MSRSLLLGLALFASSCGFEESAVRQIGYYRADNGIRIFTLSISDSSSSATARRHAERLPHTEGQMMAAYYYPEGSQIPGDAVTLGRNFVEITDMLYEAQGLPDWRYVYIRNFNAPPSFVDCQKTPNADLCRQ